MLYEKQEFTMKNGKTAVLRSPRREDAEAMLLYIRRMSEETEFVGRYPEEITETLESEADFLEQCVESKNSIQISAFVDGELAGNASISPFSERMKLRHRADFGIAVLQPWWGLGLGRALTQACLERAKEMGFAQVELSLLKTNEKGLKLYQSTGFEVWGELKNGFHLKDGTCESELCMVKYF